MHAEKLALYYNKLVNQFALLCEAYYVHVQYAHKQHVCSIDSTAQIQDITIVFVRAIECVCAFKRKRLRV